MRENVKSLLILHVMFAVYALSGVFNKTAALEGHMSVRFVLCYGGSLCLMVFYALIWQQVIKKLQLTVAYANKAVVVIWGLIWGIIFFKEEVTVGKLVGILMVFCGIVLFALAGEKKGNADE